MIQSWKVLCKIKLFRDPTLEDSDRYEFKTSLFGNIEPEGFLFLFTCGAPPCIT